LNRSSWLRVEPDQSPAPIRKLFPGELVRLRKAPDTWVEVEVFDYGGGSTVGWAEVGGRRWPLCDPEMHMVCSEKSTLFGEALSLLALERSDMSSL